MTQELCDVVSETGTVLFERHMMEVLDVLLAQQYTRLYIYH